MGLGRCVRVRRETEKPFHGSASLRSHTTLSRVEPARTSGMGPAVPAAAARRPVALPGMRSGVALPGFVEGPGRRAARRGRFRRRRTRRRPGRAATRKPASRATWARAQPGRGAAARTTGSVREAILCAAWSVGCAADRLKQPTPRSHATLAFAWAAPTTAPSAKGGCVLTVAPGVQPPARAALRFQWTTRTAARPEPADSAGVPSPGRVSALRVRQRVNPRRRRAGGRSRPGPSASRRRRRRWRPRGSGAAGAAPTRTRSRARRGPAGRRRARAPGR